MVRNAAGKVAMECVIETNASMILQFIDGLRGDLQVTCEEGTSAAWLYDLLKPHVAGDSARWYLFKGRELPCIASAHGHESGRITHWSRPRFCTFKLCFGRMSL